MAAAVEDVRGRLAQEPQGAAGRAGWDAWNRDTGRLEKAWIPALVKAGRHREAAELALVGLATGPRVWQVDAFARQRALALLADGDAERALPAARSYYDACGLEQTVAAIDVVAKCLAAARPGTPDAGRRFRLGQMDGATTRPYAALSPEAVADAPAAESSSLKILAEIGRDADADAVLQDTLDRYADGRSLRTLLKRGNLLLLLGRAEEARPLFEQAVPAAAADGGGPTARANLTAEALDGIARCMKAQDGAVGRANAFVLKLKDAAGR